MGFLLRMGRDGDWRRLAVVVELGAIAAWLWPIGLGGQMPVGGDVTQFSLGPMAVLGRSIRAGHLPFWNELWGYGFPGVGESQMGVYYPPHLLLYGLLPPESAYTVSLLLHTLWGGLGAYFAGRRLGASMVGASVGGFAWSTCGFFVIHLPHQWGYTTGCWMPWAWGLAWSVIRNEANPRDPFLLALVLAVQLLPGHFQLAFCTQVGVLVLAIEQGIERLVVRSGGWTGLIKTCVALAGAFALSACQLWPTFRLARLAAPHRDFEYLSGFATTPLHLVTFLTPNLFERSPLWRPLVWDPFHTSPEESLGFIGVVPLFLALGAIGTGLRRRAAVRGLSALAATTLVFALGPYVPGFEHWCATPGFSFFRGHARWLLATSLALCSLSALGFDAIGTWRRPRRALLHFVAVGVLIPASVIALVEVALASSGRPGWPVVSRVYRRAFDALPWHEPSVFNTIVTAARKPFQDFRVQQTWARQGVRLNEAPPPVFAQLRTTIYREELAGSALVFAAMLALAPLAGRRVFPIGLIVLTGVELVSFGRQRRVDLGPMTSLASQSPVLTRLAKSPRGLRTVDSLRNMPMVPGAAPVSAYRTLDLPTLDSLTRLAGRLPEDSDQTAVVLAAFRATGAGVRIFDPFDNLALGRHASQWPGHWETIDDPALAGWLFGRDWVAQQNAWSHRFRLWTPNPPPARAWLVPLTPETSAAILGPWSGDPLVPLHVLKDATPVEINAWDPEHRALTFEAKRASLLLLSELADPEWRGVADVGEGVNRQQFDLPIARAFGTPNQGAWQAVRIDRAGPWRITLTYAGRDVLTGQILSGVALAGFLVLYGAYGRGRTQEQEGEAT